ncbi:MAG: histidine kinase [Acidobacteriota bacterium]
MLRRAILKNVGLVFGLWTTIALLFTVQAIARRGLQNWPQMLFWNLVDCYIMGAFTPLVWWIARRAHVEARSWRAIVLIHFVGAVFYSTLCVLLYFAVAATLDLFMRLPEYVSSWLAEGLPTVSVMWLPWNFITYGALLSVIYAFEYQRRLRDRELVASQLQAQLAQAQLQVLKMQLQPHFLFNTLNAISALVHSNPDAAERMIARLADLLRLTLDSSGRQEVALRDELQFLETYLDIQKMRFQDRLSVRFDIHPDTLDSPVPSLILQPIVENAVRHGIAPRAAGGHIEVRSAKRDGVLEVEVSDNGCGLGAKGARGVEEGVGLANTRARLKQLYGDAHKLELLSPSSGGTLVRLEIPQSAQAQQTR